MSNVAKALDLLGQTGFRINSGTIENVSFWIEQRGFSVERVLIDIYGVHPDRLDRLVRA
jgi:hypothetical protein